LFRKNSEGKATAAGKQLRIEKLGRSSDSKAAGPGEETCSFAFVPPYMPSPGRHERTAAPTKRKRTPAGSPLSPES